VSTSDPGQISLSGELHPHRAVLALVVLPGLALRVLFGSLVTGVLVGAISATVLPSARSWSGALAVGAVATVLTVVVIAVRTALAARRDVGPHEWLIGPDGVDVDESGRVVWPRVQALRLRPRWTAILLEGSIILTLPAVPEDRREDVRTWWAEAADLPEPDPASSDDAAGPDPDDDLLTITVTLSPADIRAVVQPVRTRRTIGLSVALTTLAVLAASLVALAGAGDDVGAVDWTLGLVGALAVGAVTGALAGVLAIALRRVAAPLLVRGVYRKTLHSPMTVRLGPDEVTQQLAGLTARLPWTRLRELQETPDLLCLRYVGPSCVVGIPTHAITQDQQAQVRELVRTLAPGARLPQVDMA
jgi:hypothetical protein